MKAGKGVSLAARRFKISWSWRGGLFQGCLGCILLLHWTSALFFHVYHHLTELGNILVIVDKTLDGGKYTYYNIVIGGRY